MHNERLLINMCCKKLLPFYLWNMLGRSDGSSGFSAGCMGTFFDLKKKALLSNVEAEGEILSQKHLNYNFSSFLEVRKKCHPAGICVINF